MIVWIPIDPSDVSVLEELLRSADPFVASTIRTDDPYRLANYIRYSAFGGREIAALLDRNLVSRLTALADGRALPQGPASSVARIAAGCMAFFGVARILTEPNISLYELAQSKWVDKMRRAT